MAGNVLECGSWKLGHILQIQLNLLFFTVDEVRGNNLENPYISWKLNSNCHLGNRGKMYMTKIIEYVVCLDAVAAGVAQKEV